MKRLIHIVIIVLLSSRAVAITNSEAIQLVNRYYQMLTNYASIDNDSPELARRISSMHIDNTGYIYPDIEIKLGGLPETKGVIISTYLTSLSDPERKRNMLLKFVPKEMNVKSNSGQICLISYTLYVYDDNVNPNTSVLKYSIPLEMSIYQSGKIKSIVKGTNTYTTAASSAKINNVWVENNASENGQVGIRIHISMSIYNLISKQCEAAAYFYTASGVALDDKNNKYCTMNGKVSCGKTFTPMYDNTLFKDFTMFMPYEELHTSGGKYKFHVILWDKSASTASELVRSDWVEFIYTYSRVAKIEKVWVDYGASENGVDGMMIHIKMTTYNLKSKQCEAAAYFYTASGVALDDKNNKYCTVNGKVSCGKTFTPTYDNTLFEDFTMFMPYSELHITQDGEYNFFVSIWDKSVSPNKELTQSNRSKFTYTFGK
jgi:hypothetical protein